MLALFLAMRAVAYLYLTVLFWPSARHHYFPFETKLGAIAAARDAAASPVRTEAQIEAEIERRVQTALAARSIFVARPVEPDPAPTYEEPPPADPGPAPPPSVSERARAAELRASIERAVRRCETDRGEPEEAAGPPPLTVPTMRRGAADLPPLSGSLRPAAQTTPAVLRPRPPSTDTDGNSPEHGRRRLRLRKNKGEDVVLSECSPPADSPEPSAPVEAEASGVRSAW